MAVSGEHSVFMAPVDPQWWLRGPVPLGARHPAAVWVTHLLGRLVEAPAPCPACGRTGHVLETLDHLFRDHACSFGEAAEWLEDLDPDMYTLAVDYLASQARCEERTARVVASLP